MPDFPLSLIMVLVSAFYSCFAYSRLGLIWEPKIPKIPFYLLIGLVYGSLSYVAVYYFEYRYMLVVLQLINMLLVKVVFNIRLIMTVFCANIHVYIYAISKIVMSSLADIILDKHIHTFGPEVNTSELSILLICTYMLASVLIYLFTLCATKPNVKQQYKDGAPGLMATIKRFTALLLVFYTIETMSEILPMTDRTMAIYHLALSLLLAVSFFLMFVYFSAVDNFTENSEQNIEDFRRRRFAYYDGQAKYLDEFRRFRHDYKNRLAGLKAFLDVGDSEKAKLYLEDISEKFDEMREHTKTYSNNTLVDSVMQNLAARCARSGIEFDATVLVGDELPLSDMDICTIFYNIADNAYDAANKEYDGKKYISFTTSRREKWLIVNAENSFDGVLITGKNNELETIKNDDISHGIGLKNVKSIVETVPGAMVKIQPDTQERIFSISIIFPRKKTTNEG